MSTWYNKSKIMMERNSSHAPKKDSTLKKLKKKRNTRKRKKLNLNPFVNLWKMSLETKLKRLWSAPELMNPHVSWLLENMDGLLTWGESWKHKLSETHPWLHTWFLKRLWKLTLTIPSLLNWERNLTKIAVTRLLRTWSGFSLKLPFSPLDSPWTSLTPLPTESIEWSS